MLIKSALFSEGSGSLGGITASRNKGGIYFRRRAIPTNPNSPQQQTIRGFVNQLSNLWGTTLTIVQRDAWETYAANVTVLNKLGDPINITGLNHYVRSNVPRLQNALPRADDGPTAYDLGDFTNPSFAYDAAAAEIDVTFDDTDDWANEDDAAMLIYGSRQQGPTINFFKGPYRVALPILGDTITPETSPFASAAPFPCAAGNRCFVFIRVSRADGRLSMPFRDFGLSA